MLLRCIAEQANAIGTRPENAPDRVAALLLDIEKAYHCCENNYRFDALQTNCFGINIKL